jgi:hypothetical protein
MSGMSDLVEIYVGTSSCGEIVELLRQQGLTPQMRMHEETKDANGVKIQPASILVPPDQADRAREVVGEHLNPGRKKRRGRGGATWRRSMRTLPALGAVAVVAFAVSRDPMFSLIVGAAGWVLTFMVTSALDERKRGRARTRKTD